MPLFFSNRIVVVGKIGLLCAAIFTIDLIIPLRVAFSVLYIFPLLMTMRLPDIKITVWTAAVCSGLTIIGLYFSPEEGLLWQMLANSTLALFVIWLTAWFIITRKHSDFNLKKLIEKKTFALQSEQQFLLVTESIPVIISYVDAEQRYKYVNAAYEKHFHIPRGSIINITMAEVMGKKVYDIARPYIELGLSGKSINFEYTYVAPDGSTRTFDVQYIPHLDSNDRTLGLYMLSNEITERKQIKDNKRNHLRSITD